MTVSITIGLRGGALAAVFVATFACSGSSGGSTGGTGGGAGTTGAAGHGAAGAAGAGGGGAQAGTGGGGAMGGAGPDAAADGAGVGIDADSDAPRCTDPGFDCPVGFACDEVIRRCTTQCSSTQPCHGGCCASAICETGLATDACGRDGLACARCGGAAAGAKCLVYPDQDSPSRPGGYCGCETGTDCPVAPQTSCTPRNNLTRCCAPTNASCTNAASCCSGVCGLNVCG